MEILVRTFQDPLYRFALLLLRNPCDAQEATQDAFVRAYQALTGRYDSNRCRELELRPWLFRITRNLAHNLRRRATREESFDETHGRQEPEIGRELDPGSLLERSRERASLEQALSRLDARGREVVLLRFIEEMPYAEIAAILAESESSLRGRVFRSLRKLRIIMEENHAL